MEVEKIGREKRWEKGEREGGRGRERDFVAGWLALIGRWSIGSTRGGLGA